MKLSRRSEPRRKHRLTRLGFHFLFVGVFAMLGGALRGFNLLLVLAGLLVGTLIMQWRWSRRSVESISVQRRLPTEAFAGRKFHVRYPLRNIGRLMPVWMIRLEDQIQSLVDGHKAVAVCGVGVLPAQRTLLPHYDCLISKRGRYRFGPMTLSTTFPFSLFKSRQIVDVDEYLYVFPELLVLQSRWRQHLRSRSGGVSTTARRGGQIDGDFFGLREWQTGDSPKWIHWRTTARLNEPAVRQFEQQRRFDSCILVDAFQLDSDGEQAVELAISLAATFIVNLVGSPSNRIVLAVAGETPGAVIGGGSREGKRRMLEMLADAVPSQQPTLDSALIKAVQVVGHTQDLIVVSPRSLDLVRLSEPQLANSISPWTRRGTCRWIHTSGAEIDRWVIRGTSWAPKISRDDHEKAIAPDATEVG